MNFFINLLIIVFAYFFINSFKKIIVFKGIRTLTKLFVYHIIFGAYYCFFLIGDANRYLMNPKKMSALDILNFFNLDFKGTYFIYILNYWPSNILGLSYFTGTMIYSFLGFMGITYFYLICIKFIPYNSKFRRYNLFPLIFFMPMLHFWSCAVGKDTLSFYCVALFAYGIIKPLGRMHYIVFALLLSYFIRPHITLFLVIAFGIAFVSGSKISNFQRSFFIFILLGIAIYILPQVLNFSKIDNASFDSFDKFSKNHFELLRGNNVGSSVDISSYPLPFKIFTFLYRPLLFDINGLPSFIASIENILLLYFTPNHEFIFQ